MVARLSGAGRGLVGQHQSPSEAGHTRPRRQIGRGKGKSLVPAGNKEKPHRIVVNDYPITTIHVPYRKPCHDSDYRRYTPRSSHHITPTA
ncbi:hypothetical protein Ppb6_00036 [Photorhabdus australis subsp. thailandensis]|uniref:Uncharacterized protein n=1 Tax=Photorhabdus australis subsp. thailandensis TaxID=2805096 RepID=A0A1C0U9T5_9GAMM|nr:hypothetical protein Ppb6_00036 [Photorhabdus australis subsp. thailandensis]